MQAPVPVTLRTFNEPVKACGAPLATTSSAPSLSHDVVRPLFLGSLVLGLLPSIPQRRKYKVVPLAEEESKSEAPAPSESSSDAGRVKTVVQRLTNAETSLQRWSYVAEVIYTWLGLISLSVAGWATYSLGGLRIFNTAGGLGIVSVGLSVACSLVGWFQARSCRHLGRRCGMAAGSLEPGGPVNPKMSLPALAAIEANLRARQRTAALGALFAVVGLQSMVGLMVTKVLATSGGFSPSPGINLDIFTLLAVSNSALGHVLAGGLAAVQQGSLPKISSSSTDPFQGWAR
ncbi:unnamed protein product [Cladocopium goreaui]|uniref:Uncharacterized protein n=1 Tax=Cladocopium goreaui TaxID=2562237 RepID=A0A9P1BUF4_9DINO|nr:unnamed protein product [Cladocopium goreaui]